MLTVLPAGCWHAVHRVSLQRAGCCGQSAPCQSTGTMLTFRASFHCSRQDAAFKDPLRCSRHGAGIQGIASLLPDASVKCCWQGADAQFFFYSHAAGTMLTVRASCERSRHVLLSGCCRSGHHSNAAGASLVSGASFQCSGQEAAIAC